MKFVMKQTQELWKVRNKLHSIITLELKKDIFNKEIWYSERLKHPELDPEESWPPIGKDLIKLRKS